MIDREKVIKGIQIERECVSRDCDRDCGKCDLVQDRDWLLSMYDDAISLLKEQEPKLLTIEEITGDGECWFEGINGACGYADCYMCTGSKEVEVNRISMKPEYVSWNDFKKKWRCWSYRPTDEQRKAVKWDD